MTTSGSSTFNRTRDQIIARAGRIIGAFKSGETMGSQEVTDFAEALNAMVKRWSATPGLHVWATSEATLFPQASQSTYALAVNGADHCTSSYVGMALTAAVASGGASLPVASTTGVTNGDYLGVILSSGAFQWTTVSSHTGTAIVPTASLTGAASSGAAVYAYTNKIVRPLGLPNHWAAVRRYGIASGQETPIGPPIARLDYRGLPSKAQTGIINQAFYDPQLTTGYMYLWQPPATVTDLVNFTWRRPLQDFLVASDNPDLPQEWLDTLAFNLADIVSPEYDVPAERADRIQARAAQLLSDVGGFDREAESLLMQVDMGP